MRGGEEGRSRFGDDLGGLRVRILLSAYAIAFRRRTRLYHSREREQHIEKGGTEFPGSFSGAATGVPYYITRGHSSYYA